MPATAADQPIRRAFDSLLRSARAFFLLEAEEHRVRSLPEDRAGDLRKLHEAAQVRTAVAADLSDARHAVVGVGLYCDAVQLLLLAAVRMYGDGPSLASADTSSIDAAFARLVDDHTIEPPPREIDEARRLIAEPRLRLDSLGPDDLAARRATLEAAVSWLRLRLEPRTVAQIRRARIARLASAALLAIAFFGWMVASLATAPNVALHRPVTASSRHPQSVAPADGSGLVNGIKEPGYGIHTTQEASAWVTVDLERTRKIAEVKIYNRADGWFNEGLPYALELSHDGTEFVLVSLRTEPFTQLLPWTYSGATEARYVRIRTPGIGYIALSEIEVFER